MTLAALALLALVHADVAPPTRFALVVGHNEGAAGEARLRYAEDDADRVADVLVALGDFRAENTVVLKGQDADDVRRALIALNDRVRTAPDAVLFVFFSGHADARALHLGRTTLPVVEVEQLVRGSSAGFRLLVVDACRSGALTRVKGAAPIAARTIDVDARAVRQGVVFLTSAASGEDAQESDEVQGSFFTHYLVSALLGAADADADGRVGLDEAYRYAYEQTLKASSRTVAGLQHPTFEYDLRGRGELVLSFLDARRTDRAVLQLPARVDFLVLEGGPTGRLVAEVGGDVGGRRVSVRPGAYFLRGRGPDALYEGQVVLGRGEVHDVALADLERSGYARLVRKGAPDRLVAQSVHAGYFGRTPLLEGAGFCHGMVAAWQLELRWLSVAPRLSACRSGSANAFVTTTTDEVSGDVRGAYAFDLPFVTVDVGGTVGGTVFTQKYVTKGRAPPRNTGAGYLGLGATAVVDLPWGFYVEGGAEGRTYAYAVQEAPGVVAPQASLVLAVDVGLGKRW